MQAAQVVAVVNRSIETSEAVAAFLEEFDAYAAMRATLKDLPDGSEDERYCINDCASRWNRLMLLRGQIR